MTVTPAEERAVRDGLPVVLALPFDLLRLAGGNPMILSTVDGSEVLVRLMTADELMESHLASLRSMSDAGIPAPPAMSRDRAVDLTRPLRTEDYG